MQPCLVCVQQPKPQNMKDFSGNLQFNFSAKELARARAAMTKQSDCHQ
jgi:hypothetical protein